MRAVCSTAIARSVVPLGLVTPATQKLPRLLARGVEERRGPDERALREVARLLLREPLADRRLCEVLHEEVEVGGAGAGDRGERVDLRLGYLDDRADGLEEASHEGDVRRRGGRAGASPVTPLPTKAGVLGIARRTTTSGPRISWKVAMRTPAARLTTTAPVAERTRSRAAGRHERGLHADEHDLGAAAASRSLGLSSIARLRIPAGAASASADAACDWSR